MTPAQPTKQTIPSTRERPRRQRNLPSYLMCLRLSLRPLALLLQGAVSSSGGLEGGDLFLSEPPGVFIPLIITAGPPK
jgi:hypothetical protein